MTAFQEYKATQKLRNFAQSPIDLTKESVLTSKRVKQMSATHLGIKLLYGTERVSEEVMKALFDLAEEAKVFDKMAAMQRGEALNQIEGYESEKRAVLHTAMRDFFDSRSEAAEAKKTTELAYAELEKLKDFLKELEKQEFTDLVQVGIGGSELGPKAVYLSLQAFSKPNRRVHFVSNVDPDDVASIFGKIELSKTLVVIVSKSGATLETRINESLIRKRFLNLGLSPKNHFIAVTCQGSPMDNPDLYRSSFYIGDSVGGRYSATSNGRVYCTCLCSWHGKSTRIFAWRT